METTPTTKRAIREFGFRPADEWLRDDAYPRRDAMGTNVKGELFFSKSQTEAVLSRSAAAKRGLQIARDALPVATRFFNPGKAIHYEVFRVSDCQRQLKKCSKKCAEL